MIKLKIKTTVIGKEATERFKKIIHQYSHAYVTIGVHEGAGSYDNGVSVVEVALWNEFGTETTPSRSFIRSTMDDKEQVINQWRDEMIANILFKQWTVEKALEAMGFRIQLLIQNKIKSNVPPALADSTMRAKIKKGRPAVTLIDSGLLLRSITYKVHIK